MMNYKRWISLVFLALFFWQTTFLPKLLKWSLLVTAWLVTGAAYRIYQFYHTCGRDIKFYSRGAKFLLKLRLAKWTNTNFVQAFRKTLKKHPEKTMFIDADSGETWTFKQVEEYSNRVAHLFLDAGFQKGDSVALMMENRPEYNCLWLGMAKVGVLPALINTNLRNDSLVHSITVASCKAVVFGQELEQAVLEVMPKLKSTMGTDFKGYRSVRKGTTKETLPKDIIDMDLTLEKSSPNQEPARFTREIGCKDPLFYIYTSGTTGLPKPVIIKHLRQTTVCLAVPVTAGMTPDDVMYCYLPLYHSSGSQVGTGAAFMLGSTTVIKRKFSASGFWKDCIKYNVTASQYIGEICRFLLATKETPEEKQHKVRLFFGNGLKAQIWEQFQNRFNIADIGEFYGATEGNSSLMNISNKVGACGSRGLWVPDVFHDLILPLEVIRVDRNTGEPIRGPDGLCIKVGFDEPGEFVGKIVRNDPLKDFEGYRDKAATEKKVLRDVMIKGDAYFRSGDIFVMDKFGYMYFQDRVGDTFRWKGENVSTQEVEAVISNVLGLTDATVYGVTVPNSDGRAGMVAIANENQDDNLEEMLTKLWSGVKEKLPVYARPVFVRIVSKVEFTGTFKLKKSKLQEEGFDVDVLSDPLFVANHKDGKYTKLDSSVIKDIAEGKLKI